MTSQGQGLCGRVRAWWGPNTTSRRYELPPGWVGPALGTSDSSPDPFCRGRDTRCVTRVRTRATSHPPAETRLPRSRLAVPRRVSDRHTRGFRA